jgi:hypothetical protein
MPLFIFLFLLSCNITASEINREPVHSWHRQVLSQLISDMSLEEAEYINHRISNIQRFWNTAYMIKRSPNFSDNSFDLIIRQLSSEDLETLLDALIIPDNILPLP